METAFDIIVIGLGANGSSALYHLAKSGCRAMGIDRFAPPHRHGSSHGQSRIIRQAYHEKPLYVPFVKEAFNLWKELEQTSGQKLLLVTGGLILGDENAAVVQGAKESAESYDLPFDYLDSGEIKSRFPALKPSPETVGIFDKTAGILFPETCIETYLKKAQELGAAIRCNETVIRIVPGATAVEIITDKNTYQTSRVILSAGAWTNALLPGRPLPLVIERQVLYWLKSKKPQPFLTADALPIYIWEYKRDLVFYGFPDLGDGIKTAFHQGGQTVVPDELTGDVAPAEIDAMINVVEAHIDIEAAFNYSATCMYTNTPDGDFIIDFHPLYKNIIVASPCSGHGFKFSCLTGKLLCQMALGESFSFDLSPFRMTRF